MEYPLRTLAMVAQVQAGMWRRNGYAVMNQVYRFMKSIFLCQLLNFSLTERLKPQKERNILIARLSSLQSLVLSLERHQLSALLNFKLVQFTVEIVSRTSVLKINTYMSK